MAAAFMSHAAAALRRGFLLVGVLAIMAGFLGMHIMTGMHGAHAMTAAASSAEPAAESFRTAHSLTPDPVAPSRHDGTHNATASDPVITAGPELAGNSGTAAPTASCECQSSCTDPSSMRSTCVPSAAVASLVAPPPGAAPTSLHNPDPRGQGSALGYSYLPASPSPGELSISRT
jgi:hypothetical protein